MKRCKKAYTLIEVSIVLIVLAIVLGTYISSGKVLYSQSRIQDTKADLQKIKQELIGYAIANGKLPLVDSNGDGVGDTNGTIGTSAYITLQSKSKDSFAQPFSYDMLDALSATTPANICATLASVNTVVDFPRVYVNSSTSEYAVAAVIISKGEDKVLTGKNIDGTRIYESINNTYNATTNDDLVIELSVLELYGAVCP